MQYLMEKMSSSDAPPMCFDMLKTITDDFSENMKIGIGGYGEVYKVCIVTYIIFVVELIIQCFL